MKSMKKLVLAALILLASVVVLAGCKNDSVPEVPKYTVKFAKGNNTDEVSDLPADLTVESGTVLTAEQLKPLTNTKNYVFVGWYDGETKAVAGTYTVTENVTLTAQWESIIVNVTEANFTESLTKAMANPGIILILESDIIVSETIKIESGNVTIDLNGKTLQNESGTVVEVAEGATLTILDNGEGGEISGDFSGVENYGTLTVKDGIISGSGADSIGVSNLGTGMLSVEGGAISGIGQGVYNDGTLTVKDGIISGSTGVFNLETRMLTIEGGKISGIGKGVSNDGTLTVTGGIISGSGADSKGVFNGETGRLTVEGGEISGISRGVENYGTVTVNAGIISGSGASSEGVYNLATGMLTVEGGVISGISRGVDNSGTVTVNAGIISGSDEVSQGVFNGEDGKVTVEGGEIRGVYHGVYNLGTVTVNAGIISGSDEVSQGVFNGETGRLTVEGGEISGVFRGVDNWGTVTVNAGIISSSGAGSLGVYNSGTLYLSGDPVITSAGVADFFLTDQITLVGDLTGTSSYFAHWYDDSAVGSKIVVGGKLPDGGEDYKLPDDITEKFTFNVEVELDSSQNALVVQN